MVNQSTQIQWKMTAANGRPVFVEVASGQIVVIVQGLFAHVFTVFRDVRGTFEGIDPFAICGMHTTTMGRTMATHDGRENEQQNLCSDVIGIDISNPNLCFDGKSGALSVNSEYKSLI